MRTPEKDQEDHDSMDPSEDRGTVGSLPLTSSTSFTATPPLPIRNQGSGEALIKFKSGVVRGGGEKVEQGGGWIDSNRFGSQAGSIFRLLSKLEDLSVEKSIHLPRLVLLGNQSVGKSSLVEVISGITVPRCFGTCTRGPLDVITRPPGSEDEEEGEEVVVVGKNGGGGAKLFEPKWSAKVSLKIRKVGGGGNLSGTGGDGGFRVIPFGPRIQDQSKVSERLRRAAVALRNLNHNQGGGGGRGGMMVGNLKEFLWMDLEELSGYEGSGGSEVNFFTDRIEVEVVGSGMPPLRFTDLPGIFTNGDREEIETVEAMILDEIKDPECLIAQVASLSMDYANQSSFNLSGKVDPGGERTIGIFTMPDLLQLEGDLSWLPVLRGEKARLRHGWHVVKCPSPRDLSNVPTMGGGAEGRERNEQDFFQRSDTAWASVASEIDQDFLRKRLGSRNLCSFLGGLLLQRVKKRLPGCLDSIREARLLKEDQLSELPKGREEDLLSSLSPLEELFNLCRDLTTKFNHLCCESDELLQAEEKLRLSVSDCSPDYVPFSSEEIEDHEVEALFVPRPFHPSSSASGSSIVPPPSRPCPSENDLDSEILDQDSKRLTKDQIRRMKNLDQVRIALRLQRTYLPSAVGLLATTHQVDAQGRFAKVSKPYVKQTKSALGQVINRLIHQVFQEWPDLKGRVTWSTGCFRNT
ncbi:hypothetical protein IE53DRAFT_43714 [Violaceomyces palustris]|uniref:Uncharacterized protein n=1 Tax=Violaceomyces palustris TaxID=1673888 RepID=A0ACD0P0Q2_9BASI|nr:hypothetical protein IE53DRAFT_43714 [Violaceomyces palustris]